MEDHSGHRGRLREQYIKTGGKGFAAHNLMELLLFYSIPRRDTNGIAHALLKRFGTVSGVLNATVEELCQVKGISESSAILIKIVGELSTRFCQQADQDLVRFYSYEDIGSFVQSQFVGVSRERVIALYIDNAGRLIKLAVACEGSVNSARLDIRGIVTAAMAANAGAVVVAHNHPGGSAIPSPEDLDTTRLIKKMLNMAAIDLIEHFVVAEDGICRLLEKCEEQDGVNVRQRFSFKEE